MKIWVRCGDADGYNAFDDLQEAAEYLYDMGVRLPLDQLHGCGLTAAGFARQNYISCFYGDDAEPELRTHLSAAAVAQLRLFLGKADDLDDLPARRHR